MFRTLALTSKSLMDVSSWTGRQGAVCHSCTHVYPSTVYVYVRMYLYTYWVCVCGGDTLYTLYCAYVLYYQVLLIVHRYSIVKLWTCRYVLYVFFIRVVSLLVCRAFGLSSEFKEGIVFSTYGTLVSSVQRGKHTLALIRNMP